MISNCGHDERNRYSGGKAGDQTGHEWEVIPWYNRPWNVVLRYPISEVGQKIADLARAAAKNDNIGYDQDQRYTYWYALRSAGYDPSKIDVLCEADCSAGVAANIKAAGFLMGIKALRDVSIYAYTGNLKQILRQAGFQVLTDQKYLESDEYLLPGDVLLYEGHHTAVNLDRGSRSGDPELVTYPRWLQSGTDWYYRTANGVNAHGWKVINHHWYYFDSNGKMLKNWFQVNGEWYYGQPDGPLEGALYRSDSRGAMDIWYVD